jgi:hypothetical protein
MSIDNIVLAILFAIYLLSDTLVKRIRGINLIFANNATL